MATENPVSARAGRLRRLAFGIAAASAWCGLSVVGLAAEPSQATFASPEAAADALAAAARADKPSGIDRILGPAGRKLVHSGDRVADKEGREKFVAAYDEKHAVDKPSENTAILVISGNEWPFPIPLVKQGDAWRFDTAAGADEILNRRIGRNELNAIEVCKAIVDAEHDYAAKDRTGSGHLEYAQKFASSPGKRDGLYWPTAAGEESPIGPLVVRARAEGYGGKDAHGRRSPYQGYYYRILTRQGPNAPGGAYSYIVNGHMIGGFAVVAFPAKYDDSGVMTFMTGEDGAIYEKNLGRDTAAIARRMTSFDPDPSWAPHR